MAAASSVLQIQELCDYIVDFLYNNPASLKVCALLSRPLVSSAQYHLFYEVRFGNGIKWNDGGASRRFCAIMKSSPHLLPLIQRMQASFTPDVLGQLCDLELPNLRDVVLFRPIKDNIRVPNSTSVAYAARLISFPSIRHVKLQDLVLEIDNVAQLFQHCNPAFNSLSVSHINVSAFSATGTHSRRAKQKIKTLSFDSLMPTGSTHTWLVHFLTLFNFEELEELNLGTVSPALLKLLHSSRQSIRKLQIYAQEVNLTYTRSPLSPAILAQLPFLTNLSIGSLGTELKDVETLLGGLPTPNGVKHLRIEIMTWPHEDRLRELGKTCASMSCTIEVALRQPISRGLNKGDIMALVRTAFLEVNERGRLLVAADGDA
ncbi:hypothetical protein MSAN_00607700 [Mycena sanguinolenta]|uniref:Uncharacterized protein n=1 Tax=Mycena sanguinolenta TaxID=230812 RepID=A0A8H6ZAG0_9AGAR|nr:hypothetical protein MSAN_00607700 [Mycena sanguinolenta]